MYRCWGTSGCTGLLRATVEPKMEAEYCELQTRAATAKIAAADFEDQLLKVSIAIEIA